jgi:hypothetical protein
VCSVAVSVHEAPEVHAVCAYSASTALLLHAYRSATLCITSLNADAIVERSNTALLATMSVYLTTEAVGAA